MICFADNDIILKLAEFDLLEEALQALGILRSEVRVLTSARYYLQRRLEKHKRKSDKQHTEAGLTRALNFVLSVKSLHDQPDEVEHELLLKIENIDEGEAVLFASTKHLEDFIIATGDKRALVAICKEPSCKIIYERIKKRVICLEQMILKLISTLGFETVKAKILPCVQCDTALRMAFRADYDESQTTEGLFSYITSTNRDTGDILSAMGDGAQYPFRVVAVTTVSDARMAKK